MARRKSVSIHMVLLLLGLLFLGLLGMISQGYLQEMISRPAVCFLALIVFLFFGVLWFEGQTYGAATLILLALCIVMGALGRVVFAWLPSVQPTSFIVIICGMVFGGRFGFMVGVGAAFSSNLLLGHGPWSLWQMAAWGGMGLFSGVLGAYLASHRMLLVSWGFVSGLLFGVGMNVWSVLTFMPSFSWGALVTACATSIYFDLAHGLSNSIFLYWQGERWQKLLLRAKKQYRI
ncbi:MAG: ECF transporter S component [Peptococcaceae bacterium]|nr:ECF transporter S component [Peptococcaceae bacterium]